jgi:hypothetical protein
LPAWWYPGTLQSISHLLLFLALLSFQHHQRVNLHGNPHVVLTTDDILTTGCTTWEEGLDVVVEGDAVQVTDDEVLERVASVWATKWGGESWNYQVRDGYFYLYNSRSAVFSVKPRKVFATVKGRSQTRHQF